MKITAIICEFNPLHIGHKKLIDYAKTFSDKVICIMSGNFTQRGLPAYADKYSRAKHAVLAGADLVVELPTVFAAASANFFATGGVKIANSLNADYLLFGSECGNIEELEKCANGLNDVDTNAKIKENMYKGMSYPKSVAAALNNKTLDSPNNTLAVEYLLAIKQTNSKIIPITIKRENNYNSLDFEECPSSSALRQDTSLLEKYSFEYVAADCNNIEQKYCAFASVALSLISKEKWQNIESVSEGIENKFMSADKSKGYEYLIGQVKSKRFTRAKLQRIILNAILDITKEDATASRIQPISPLPLAVAKGSEQLLCMTSSSLSDDITLRADNLFYALGGKKPPLKLQVIGE